MTMEEYRVWLERQIAQTAEAEAECRANDDYAEASRNEGVREAFTLAYHVLGEVGK